MKYNKYLPVLVIGFVLLILSLAKQGASSDSQFFPSCQIKQVGETFSTTAGGLIAVPGDFLSTVKGQSYVLTFRLQLSLPDNYATDPNVSAYQAYHYSIVAIGESPLGDQETLGGLKSQQIGPAVNAKIRFTAAHDLNRLHFYVRGEDVSSPDYVVASIRNLALTPVDSSSSEVSGVSSPTVGTLINLDNAGHSMFSYSEDMLGQDIGHFEIDLSKFQVDDGSIIVGQTGHADSYIIPLNFGTALTRVFVKGEQACSNFVPSKIDYSFDRANWQSIPLVNDGFYVHESRAQISLPAGTSSLYLRVGYDAHDLPSGRPSYFGLSKLVVEGTNQ